MRILTARIDGEREIHFPESKLKQYQGHFGPRMKLIDSTLQTSRFISPDEQRAAKTAIEEEQHHYHSQFKSAIKTAWGL
jgi:RNA binding exosome subunit